MSLLAEACALVGDQDSAPVLYRLLGPWAALHAVDPVDAVRGATARYLGLLASTMENWADAERHYQAALAANDAMGLRPWHAYTQADYARMLVARGRTADRERARALRDAACTAYAELGMRPAAGLNRP